MIKLGKVKFWVDRANWADSKVDALFEMHQLSDVYTMLNACFFYVEQIILNNCSEYNIIYAEILRNL